MSEWTSLYDLVLQKVEDSDLIDLKFTTMCFTTHQAAKIAEDDGFEEWPFYICCIKTNGASEAPEEYEVYLKIHESYSHLFSKEIEKEFSDNRKRDWYRIKRLKLKELNTSYPLKLYKLLEERLLLNGL